MTDAITSASFSLRELEHARQIPGDYPRRVFHGQRLQVIVWYEKHNGKGHGVQVCFGHDSLDHAVTQVGDRPPVLHHLDEGKRLNSTLLRANGQWEPGCFWQDWGALLSTLPQPEFDEIQRRLGRVR